MNGDIISDLGSALIGGLGFAPGANIGDDYAIFEAVHGSAPKYAGQNTINPTAVLLSALMMLRHLGEFEAAHIIEHALYVTMDSDGILTRDVALPSSVPASTTEFADAIIKNLGEKHPTYEERDYKPITLPKVSKAPDFVHVKERQVVGLDVFIETTKAPEELGKSMETICASTPFELRFVSCRGVKCYPGTQIQGGDFVDQARCRFFMRNQSHSAANSDILDLLHKISAEHMWGHVEKLHIFDSKPGFTKPHGED
jgi:isocitrate dehydrogenase